MTTIAPSNAPTNIPTVIPTVIPSYDLHLFCYVLLDAAVCEIKELKTQNIKLVNIFCFTNIVFV